MPRKGRSRGLKKGERCPCGRNGSHGSSLVQRLVYTAGQPPRRVCLQCADDAPLASVIRRLNDPLPEVAEAAE